MYLKHGMTNTPEYRCWQQLKNRCLNPKHIAYPDYGGRGITIHETWVNDFLVFFRDVGLRPSPKHSLDRLDNERGYEPGNCAWKTPEEQRNNRRPHRPWINVRWAIKPEQNLKRRPTITGEGHGNYDHGHTGSPEYTTWGGIKTRCFNQKHNRYRDYGGLGTTMCQRWKDDFTSFLADLGTKPSPEHALLRKNSEGHYSCGLCDECQANGWPPNCKWGTKTEQNRNRRPSTRSGKLNEMKVASIHEMLATGKTYREIAEVFGVGLSIIGKIKRGQVWKIKTFPE